MLRSRYNFIVEAHERPVGHVAIEADWDRATSAEFGIVIDASHQHRGLGFKAAGFAEEGRAREARLEGDEWIDYVYFSILRREWAQRL